MIRNVKSRCRWGETHWVMFRTIPGFATFAQSVKYGPVEAIHSPHAVAARIWRARRELRQMVERATK